MCETPLCPSGVSFFPRPARYGGEELAIILPDTALENGLRVAEQIRGTLASKRLQSRHSGQSYGKITLSVGVAALRPGGAPGSGVARADRIKAGAILRPEADRGRRGPKNPGDAESTRERSHARRGWSLSDA